MKTEFDVTDEQQLPIYIHMKSHRYYLLCIIQESSYLCSSIANNL